MTEVPGAIAFLIVGTPRSGTTLVQRLACELPGVAVPPETHFFAFWRSYGREQSFPLRERGIRQAVAAFLEKSTSRGLDLDPTRVVTRLSGHCSSPTALFEAIVVELAGPAEVYGEKTPRHVTWWKPISEALPAVRLIGVVRDPRAVIASLRRQPRVGSRRPDMLAERWRAEQYELLSASRELGPSRVLIVRYEDVVESPDRIRRRMATFLERPAPTSTTPVPFDQIALSWEDWKRPATGPIVTRRTAAWQSELDQRAAQEIAAICRRPMLKLGYSDHVPNALEALAVKLRLGRYNRHRFRRRGRLRRDIAHIKSFTGTLSMNTSR